uniref:Heterogeneous nuclear ribonucleoprotein U 1 n=1 Tax=Solanum tuberosum TaxID=4113 RepID=M1C1B3_SOLTU
MKIIPLEHNILGYTLHKGFQLRGHHMNVIPLEHIILGYMLHLVPDTTDCGNCMKFRNTEYDCLFLIY